TAAPGGIEHDAGSLIAGVSERVLVEPIAKAGPIIDLTGAEVCGDSHLWNIRLVLVGKREVDEILKVRLLEEGEQARLGRPLSEVSGPNADCRRQHGRGFEIIVK